MEDLALREEQVRRLAEHMLHVEEIERRRISRELHDEAGQSLLCIRLQMEMLEQNMPAGSQAAEREWMAKLREARDLTERTILEMRRLIAALSVLEQLGLGAALRQLLNRFRRLHPCRMKLQMYKLEALPQQSQIIVYRLVQECCNNIGKHSGANQVNICVHFADGVLRLYVEDNGAGFNVGGLYRATAPSDYPECGNAWRCCGENSRWKAVRRARKEVQRFPWELPISV